MFSGSTCKGKESKNKTEETEGKEKGGTDDEGQEGREREKRRKKGGRDDLLAGAPKSEVTPLSLAVHGSPSENYGASPAI